MHHTIGHDLEKCKTFLDRKKMVPSAAPAPKEPRRGEHRWVNPDGDEQMGEINVIFEGGVSIASETQGKKFKREISLAQRIEPRRMIKWSDVDISFGLEDHPDTELS
jgi:hypothetical protein